MADEMTITILDDGTIKTETNPVSAANHQSAEAFMADLARFTGGAVERQKKGHRRHQHVHHQVEQKS